MLDARYKPVRDEIGRVRHWRALCGFAACPGHLARLDRIPGPYRTNASKAWDVRLGTGFVEVEGMPGHWALSKHAQKSRRHAPRSPAGCGHVVPHSGAERWYKEPAQGRWVQLAHKRVFAKRYSTPPLSIGEFTIRDSLFVGCPSCGRESVVTVGTVAQLAAAVWREESERAIRAPWAPVQLHGVLPELWEAL